LIRRKKEVKRILLSTIILISILLTSVQVFNILNNNVDQFNNENGLLDEKLELYPSSDPYLSDYYITGSGVGQDVRIYVANSSNSYTNQDFFNIPSMSDTDVGYLTYGNFNFTFQNNYTTEYILEDDNSLDATSFIDFDLNSADSSIAVNTGNNLDPLDFDRLDVGDPDVIRINASNGIVNFTIIANYTGAFDSGVNLFFHREFILGLILSLSYELTQDAYVTLKMLDISDSTWKNVTEPILINSSLGVQQINERIINKNLNFIDLSNSNHIQFFIERFDTTEYIISLDTFQSSSSYGFDLPITNDDYVALEFDLKGMESTVNGFYAWIRTVNLTEAINSELNITLYEANRTIPRTDDINQNDANLRTIFSGPDNSKMIDSFLVNYNEYHGDDLYYFEFNTANTANLPLSNYFIVIKSNRSEIVYRLATLPRLTYGDPDRVVDHQLKTTTNNGTTWNNAIKTVETTSYISEPLDASSFKINVTRGYMPSDFIYSEDDTLNIQDISITNQANTSYPYNESSSLTWGLGQWNNNFTTPITSDGFNNFKIDLAWNTSDVKGFLFDVSYSVEAFWIENAVSFYNVSYDIAPEWSLNYSLDLGYKNFNNWDYLEFWFVYPSDYQAHNLTNPIPDEIYDDIVNETGGEKNLVENPSLDATIVTYNITNGIDGLYSLYLNSTNLIHQTHSYIKYGVDFWETNGFMYGDDVTVEVDIQDHNGNAPSNGDADVILFYPENGTKYVELPTDSSGVIEGSTLSYDFDDTIILQVRNDLPVFGNYYLGFFWTNDSAVGCKKLKLYINTYNVSMDDFFYETITGTNVLAAQIDKVYDNYSILIGTVNETTGLDTTGFFPVNNSDLNQKFNYRVSGNNIPIVMKTFLQNETILNPNENVKIKTSIQNLHEFVNIKIKLGIKLVSLANEEWIIDQQNTTVKTLKLKGAPLGQDTQEFSVDLSIPTLQPNGIWPGFNAPIRKGGAKAIITIYIESRGEYDVVGNFESTNYALIINNTESEFEGYILALKYNQEITSALIQKPFNRDECVYLPDETIFAINIFDRNYVSSYSQFIDSFTLKTNSIFSNISINPDPPIRGSVFNFSSVLTTEFDEILPNKNVTLQYFNDSSWDNMSYQLTDVNGSTIFEIDTLLLNDEDQLVFRLTWNGSTYVRGIKQNVTVNLFQTKNEVTLTLSQNVPLIYTSQNSTVQLSLINTGNSVLKIIDLTLVITPNVEFSIVEINNLILDRFSPGVSSVIIFEINVPAISQLEINVTIETENIITKEITNFHTTRLFEVYSTPLLSYLTTYFILIILGIFLLIWGFAFIFSKRSIKKIETPIEEPTKKRPRRARYVKVSELEEIPKEEIKDKKIKKSAKKKKVEKEVTEEKATDLDSLLEEEGLKDNNDK